MKSAARIVVSALVGLLAIGVVVPAPAPAATRDRIVLSLDKPVDLTMPRLLANNPALVANPPICSSSGRLSNACDLIPITVDAPPGVDDFYFEITVTWTELVGGTNDMDIYLYDDTQRVPPTTYTEISESATSNTPDHVVTVERIALVQPEYKTYNLTVNNYSGPNQGYRVQAVLGLGEIGDSFELLEPPSEFSDNSDAPAAPVDAPSAPQDLSGDVGGGLVDEFTFSDLAEVTDDELDASGFGTGEPSALPPAPTLPADLLSNEPPGPASGVLLFLSLIVVPALIAGGGAFFVFRGRRSAFGLT